MTTQNPRKYRFAPLFIASFVRTFFAAIYGLALPNNYVFGEGVSAGFVGLISSIPAITYVAGPFLGRYITNKTKSSKTTIIISSIFSVLMMILVVILVSSSNLTVVILVIIFRSLEGLSNGMFWPEMFNYITSWEQSPSHNGKKIDFLKYFNLSWNLGLISGFLTGYVLVELIESDYIAMIISVVIAGLSLINLIFFESNENFQVRENRAVTVQNFKILPQNREDFEHPEKAPYTSESLDTSLYKVPLIMGIGGILFFASTKSILRFTLPYFLEDIFTIESQWVYLIVLGQQALQIIGLQVIRKFKKMRIGYWISVVVIFSSIIILLFPPNIYVLVILNITTGFFFGLIHGVAQRIILDKGKHYNSKKYTMLAEAFIGVAFGVPPIAAGFLYDLKLGYVFLFQIGLLTVLTVILLVNHFKYMKKEGLGRFSTLKNE
ncbi:MAG: MFS transporter [Promethearchaeota archaeon]